jgi:hypothetical protein
MNGTEEEENQGAAVSLEAIAGYVLETEERFQSPPEDPELRIPHWLRSI